MVWDFCSSFPIQLDLITDSATSPTSPFISNPNGEGENSTEAETAGEEGTEEAEETPAVATPTSAGASLRQVSSEEAAAYAKEAGGLLFFEASAKTGKGVQELFTEIGECLPVKKCLETGCRLMRGIRCVISQEPPDGFNATKDPNLWKLCKFTKSRCSGSVKRWWKGEPRRRGNR